MGKRYKRLYQVNTRFTQIDKRCKLLELNKLDLCLKIGRKQVEHEAILSGPVKLHLAEHEKTRYRQHLFQNQKFRLHPTRPQKNGDSFNRHPHLQTDSQTKSNQSEIAQSGKT
jgi:hypothetical protein